MVSRVYTPIITPYNRAQAGQNRGPVSSPMDDPKPEQRAPFRENTVQPQPSLTSEQEALEARRSSVGLQAVQIDRFQKIPLDAVLHDFRSTMNALGTDDATRAEVGAYLKVVSLQGTKENPEVPFIKHTLKTAAGALDQYISKALGQPSTVVKEWVDALLMQDIDYHTNQLFQDEKPATAKSKEAKETTDEQGASESQAPDVGEQAETAEQATGSGLSVNDKSRLKTLIEQAKTEQQSGSMDSAQNRLQEALELLTGNGQPELEGKVWHLRGRYYDKSGDWQQAVHAYEQAANGFGEAGHLPKQAQAMQAAASILEEHGQVSRALEYYRQVVTLDEQIASQTGDRGTLARSLSDLGSAYLREGSAGSAVATLELAATEADKTRLHPKAESDIFSNLGAAYRSRKEFDNAEQAYRRSLGAAKASRDKSRYIGTLQQLASLYVDASRPEQAVKVLERLRQLQG